MSKRGKRTSIFGGIVLTAFFIAFQVYCVCIYYKETLLLLAHGLFLLVQLAFMTFWVKELVKLRRET